MLGFRSRAVSGDAVYGLQCTSHEKGAVRIAASKRAEQKSRCR